MLKFIYLIVIFPLSLFANDWLEFYTWPPEEKKCLFYDATNHSINLGNPMAYIRWQYLKGKGVQVTHWMPLPDPPDQILGD